MQGQAARVVAVGFELAELVDRFEQGEQEGLEHGAGADDPGGDAVDAGVEEVEADVDAVEEVAADEFLGDGQQVVVEDDDVVAVPADAAADVEQDLGRGAAGRRRSCRRCVRWGGSGRRRGRAAFAVLDGVAEVELVRADDVALRADAEELALDGVEVVGRVERLGEDRVERFGEARARGLAVDGGVLHAVGDPDVGHAGGAEGLAHRGADLAAGDAVLDPEAADAGVGVGEGEAVGGLGVGEVGGVEVEPEAVRFAPSRSSRGSGRARARSRSTFLPPVSA